MRRAAPRPVAGGNPLTTVVSYLRLVAFFSYSALMLVAIAIAAVARPGTLAYWGPAQAWIRGMIRIFGVTLVVRGREHLHPERPCVVMANHRSQLDPVAMGAAVLPRVTRWVAKKELRRVPLFGQALELTGQIFIDRGDTSSAVRSLAEHAGDRDALICFFPEGHRSSTRQMLPFKKGAAAFAISAGLPVLPMAVSGSERCLANHAILPHAGTIRVWIGEPIETAGMTDDDRARLTDTVRERLSSMLVELEGPPPVSDQSWRRRSAPPAKTIEPPAPERARA